jgi:L-alanine-DL-glutamate epimerase-like enolase superfamily enzyme
MELRLLPFPLTKAVPLAISRGTTAAVEHLLVELEQDGLTGIGETGGFETGHRHYTTAAIAAELQALAPRLRGLAPQPQQALEPLLASLSPPARCGLDLALHDWWGKRLGVPLHRLWGLDPQQGVPTSVTLGLGSVEAVLGRLERWWSQLPATRIKLKLGSSEGLDHDRALVMAVSEALDRRRQAGGPDAELQVDANGGWDLEGARAMVGWLGDHQVALVEQPLPPLADPEADAAAFAALELDCPIALVADESCWTLADVVRLAPFVDGVNIKLLKSGGLSEALLMAQAARRLGLEVMLGWLAERGVVLVEQPLPPLEDPEADAAAFADLELDCPIPLVADESCWNLADVIRLAPYVDGVNIKLLKSGGLTEALLMAQACRRLGLGVMLGCYSDSRLLNGAAAQLLPLVDWPDLDSHLNLIDDPFRGLRLEGERVLPGEGAGLGVALAAETAEGAG